jgi:hypothetical protein
MAPEKPLNNDLDVEKARKQKKAEELDNSTFFDVHKWSDYPETNKAVDALFVEFNAGPKFSGRDELKKKHIKVVILNLYVAWQIDPECYVAFYRRESEYRAQSRYNSLHISKKTIIVVDALLRKKYITQITGNYARSGGFRSHISRMRATQKLIDLIVDTYGITEEMVEIHPHRECIRLREYDEVKKKQVDVHIYNDTPETRRMRAELYAYNNLLRRTFIDIPHFPIEGIITGNKKTRKGRDKTPIKLDRTDKFVQRIFSNKSWDDGGRFYSGWWQRLPGMWRQRIRINDEPVAELDYSGLHIVMLYAIEGIDYWKDVGTDPYQLGQGYESSERMRDLLKLVLLTIINAKTQEKAIKAVRWEVNKNPNEFGWVKDEGLKLEEIVERFQECHEKISRHFSSGMGVALQNSDSHMAELVIKKFTSRGIPILCVHDSFVVQSQHEDLLWDEMEGAWKVIAKEMTDKLERSDSKIKKAEPVERWEEIRENGYEVSSLKMGQREFDKLAKVYGFKKDGKGQMVRTTPDQQGDVHGEIIKDQMYLDKVAEKDDPEYIRRWTSHQKREWEEVYFRKED